MPDEKQPLEWDVPEAPDPETDPAKLCDEADEDMRMGRYDEARSKFMRAAALGGPNAGIVNSPSVTRPVVTGQRAPRPGC